MHILNILLIITAIILALIVILILSLTVLILLGANDRGSPFEGDVPVIVLGCFIKGARPSAALVFRLESAYSYLKSHQKAMCIVCGGQFGEYTQSEVMKNFLIKKGISADRILEDNTSRNTFENFREARKLMPKARKVYIATNTYHLYRSKKLAAEFGFLPRSLAAKTPPSRVIISYIREYCSILKYFFGKI